MHQLYFRKEVTIMMLLFDLAIFLYGGYTIYSAIQMKKTYQLNTWFLGNQTCNIRDPRGYIDYIYGRTIVMGGMAVLFGILGVINDYVIKVNSIMKAAVLLFLTVCIWFYATMSKAKRKFW